MVGVELSYQQVDEVVIAKLKTALEYLIDPSQDIYETKKNKRKNIKAFLRVLEYYMPPSEFKEYCEAVAMWFTGKDKL